MSSIRRSMQSYPLVYFTILACLFGWSLYIAAGLGADFTPLNLPLGPIGVITASVLANAAFGAPLPTAYAVLALGVYLADRHRLVMGARVTPATT